MNTTKKHNPTLVDRVACIHSWATMAAGLDATHPDFTFFLLTPPAGGWDLKRPFRVFRDADGHMRTQGVSTCGLFAERLLELAGFDVPWAGKPYVVGASIGQMIRWARKNGCWKSGKVGYITEPTVIGSGMRTHVLVPIEHPSFCSSDKIVSVDGGQLSHSNRVSGRLQKIGKCAYDVTRFTHGAVFLNSRKVVGSVDVAEAPTLPYLWAPE